MNKLSTKVLLDARKIGDGGIGVYLENLVDGRLDLREEDNLELELGLLVTPECLEKAKGLIGLAENSCIRRWKGKVAMYPERAGKYSFAEYFLMPYVKRNIIRSYDIFHSPHYTVPFFLGVKAVATVHDIIHVTHPETVFHRPIAKRLIASTLRRADKVVTVSESSARKIKEIFGKAATKMVVIPNALREGIAPVTEKVLRGFLAGLELEDGYFVFVGSDKPHKGLRELLFAWKKLTEIKENVVSPRAKLVLVGRGYAERSYRLVKELGLEARVLFFGEAKVKELACLYAGARAVLVPSREEGFGFIPLEALALGTPAVCTPVESLIEVCQDIPWYTKGFSSGDIVETILRMLSDDELRREKTAQGVERAERYTRRSCAERTFRLYEEIVGKDYREREGETISSGQRLSA